MSRYNEIMKGLQEALDYEKGKSNGTQVHRLEIIDTPNFQPEEIRGIRLACGMTQSTFSACLGVTKKAVEALEGGRSHPDGAARRLLGLMQANPNFAQDNGILKTQGTLYEIKENKPFHAAAPSTQYKSS